MAWGTYLLQLGLCLRHFGNRGPAESASKGVAIQGNGFQEAAVVTLGSRFACP